MRIRWTNPAVNDFTKICDYIEEHGGAPVARRVSISIYEQISNLSKFPELGRTGRKPETRELVLTGLPYVAIYRVSAKEIHVLRLLHGAQRWP
jgi:plasmid stabilization system protein ParE